MKIFIWFASRDPKDYGEGRQFIKIYAVANDLPEAKRKIDELIPKKGFNAEMLRIALHNTEPLVFLVPFAEVNMSDGRETVAFVAGQKAGQ